MDRDTITLLTLAVRIYRQLRAMGVYEDMPIKWNITNKAMKARGIMDQISAEYDGFIEVGSEHLSDVKGLRAQVGDMHSDLESAANVMGNSPPASEPRCAKCGSTGLTPIDYQEGGEAKHGLHCSMCGAISEATK